MQRVIFAGKRQTTWSFNLESGIQGEVFEVKRQRALAVNTPERMPGAIELPIPYSPAAPLLVDVMLNLLTIAEIGKSFQVIPGNWLTVLNTVPVGAVEPVEAEVALFSWIASNGKLAVTNWPTLPAI